MSDTILLTETIKFLKDNGKSPDDVLWVGSRDGKYSISWSEFVTIAEIKYDNGFGAQEIPGELVVVGSDWWLERDEYDGAEGWDFKTIPVKKPDAKPFILRNVKQYSWLELVDKYLGAR